MPAKKRSFSAPPTPPPPLLFPLLPEAINSSDFSTEDLTTPEEAPNNSALPSLSSSGSTTPPGGGGGSYAPLNAKRALKFFEPRLRDVLKVQLQPGKSPLGALEDAKVTLPTSVRLQLVIDLDASGVRPAGHGTGQGIAFISCALAFHTHNQNKDKPYLAVKLNYGWKQVLGALRCVQGSELRFERFDVATGGATSEVSSTYVVTKVLPQRQAPDAQQREGGEGRDGGKEARSEAEGPEGRAATADERQPAAPQVPPTGQPLEGTPPPVSPPSSRCSQAPAAGIEKDTLLSWKRKRRRPVRAHSSVLF